MTRLRRILALHQAATTRERELGARLDAFAPELLALGGRAMRVVDDDGVNASVCYDSASVQRYGDGHFVSVGGGSYSRASAHRYAAEFRAGETVMDRIKAADIAWTRAVLRVERVGFEISRELRRTHQAADVIRFSRRMFESYVLVRCGDQWSVATTLDIA